MYNERSAETSIDSDQVLTEAKNSRRHGDELIFLLDRQRFCGKHPLYDHNIYGEFFF